MKDMENIVNQLKEAISKYGTEHIDLIVDYNNKDEEIARILYHSSSNSFGIGDSYSIRYLDLEELEDLCDKLDIGFDNYL